MQTLLQHVPLRWSRRTPAILRSVVGMYPIVVLLLTCSWSQVAVRGSFLRHFHHRFFLTLAVFTHSVILTHPLHFLAPKHIVIPVCSFMTILLVSRDRTQASPFLPGQLTLRSITVVVAAVMSPQRAIVDWTGSSPLSPPSGQQSAKTFLPHGWQRICDSFFSEKAVL